MGKLWSVEIVPFDDILKIKPQTLEFVASNELYFVSVQTAYNPVLSGISARPLRLLKNVILKSLSWPCLVFAAA